MAVVQTAASTGSGRAVPPGEAPAQLTAARATSVRSGVIIKGFGPPTPRHGAGGRAKSTSRSMQSALHSTAASPSAGSNPALTNTAGLNRPKQRATPKVTISGCSDDTNYQGNYRGTGVYVARTIKETTGVQASTSPLAAVGAPSARPYAEEPPVSMYQPPKPLATPSSLKTCPNRSCRGSSRRSRSRARRSTSRRRVDR